MPVKKAAKANDVNQSVKATPPTTSRAILVTEHSEVVQNPMLSDASEATAEPIPPTTAPEVSRTAKTLQPPSQATDEEPEPTEQITTETKPAETAAAGGQPVTAEQPEKAEPPLSEPGEEKEPPADGAAAKTLSNDQPAADNGLDTPSQQSAEDARLAALEIQHQELEKLIESGTYTVPINAVRRKRSHLFIVAMSILAVVLAAAVLDVVLDTGTVNAPSAVPHTHFFSSN